MSVIKCEYSKNIVNSNREIEAKPVKKKKKPSKQAIQHKCHPKQQLFLL